jgi:peptidoglycan-associated lipoprotein
MKLTRLANLLVLALVFTLPFAGCRKRPGAVTPLPAGARIGVGDMPPSEPLDKGNEIKTAESKEEGIKSNEPGSHAGWNEDRKALEAQTVYFDFDSSVVKPAQQSKVAAVADYLKGNAGAAVKVEGHCDERGTEEYNRALGERRALAVREALVRLGIDRTRVDTISYGKDRPAEPGHDEAAWSKNRRAEFVVLTPK